MNDKTGGPEFPVPNSANVTGQEGLSLRDYFAAAAMQSIRLEIKTIAVENDAALDIVIASLASFAYKQADAMLRVREVEDD